MNKNFKKIVIIGLGLIGGSIALKLKRVSKKIQIFALNKSISIPRNIFDGIIDKSLNSLSDIPEDTGLIVLATPIKEIMKILPKLNQIRIKSLIIDTGSTKKVISDHQLSSAPNLRYVATHPLAGKEKSGFENASANLFINKKWVICPTAENNKKDLESVKMLIRELGAEPVLMASDKHDEQMSRTSHLNLVLASILVNTLFRGTKIKKPANLLPGSFRDMTRMAEMDPRLKADIVFTNNGNIQTRLAELSAEICRVLKMIKNNKQAGLKKYFEISKFTRNRLLS